MKKFFGLSHPSLGAFQAEISPTHEIENKARMVTGELSQPLRYNTVRAFGPRDPEPI